MCNTMSTCIITHTSTTEGSKVNGAALKMTSSQLMENLFLRSVMFGTTQQCGTLTGFGGPVVPEVCSIYAREEGGRIGKDHKHERLEILLI